MKTLLFMRHAKSSWDEPTGDDFNRPLAGRGKKDASRMGEFLAATGLLPDLIVSSPALRAKSTIERVVEAAAFSGELRFNERVYAATAGELLEVIRGLPDSAGSVMLVGHNPGFEEALTLLCGGAVRMPTAAIACLELGLDRWAEAVAGCGALQWLVTPKTLG